MDNTLLISIKEFVDRFRDKIEPFWDEDLLYEKYIPPANPKVSSGYCGPSSIYLIQELHHQYPDQKFSIAVGKVYKNSQEWITGKHVWIVLHVALKTSIVIDVTADQSNHTSGKTIVRDINDLAKDGINYIAYHMAKSIKEIDVSPVNRAKLLQQRVESSVS